jgi:hypothetical protein
MTEHRRHNQLYDDIQYSWEEITPETAQEYLVHNVHNRSLRERAARAYWPVTTLSMCCVSNFSFVARMSVENGTSITWPRSPSRRGISIGRASPAPCSGTVPAARILKVSPSHGENRKGR